MIALFAGTLLAIAALAFVLAPLFIDRRVQRRASASSEGAASSRAIEALREVEFDKATDKLSDTDYAALKATYTRQALEAMREEERAAPAIADEDVEAAILRYRVAAGACPACGPRPEADAVYCSSCGNYLAGSCEACGAAITQPGARFCPSCGKTLRPSAA
ncbi:MAG TPA: zinc ribbon domain-containing protein [Gemmatimonadaceae bacterium]|nr:zinc ribbon domain-containing protein [Gemmatimonadaceae bacterium]